MSTVLIMIIFGVLAVVSFVTAGYMVFAAKKRSTENQQAISVADVAFKAESASYASQAAANVTASKDPFSQLIDPVAGVNATLTNSVYAEGRLSNSTISTNELPNQTDLDRIAGLAISK